jgi:hypothetical protein
MTVTTGTVAARMGTGTVWDIGSAPDPFVYVTFNGREHCTPDATDNFAPAWTYALPPVAAGILLAGVPTVFRDRDVVGSEAICDNITLGFTQDTFRMGGGSRVLWQRELVFHDAGAVGGAAPLRAALEFTTAPFDRSATPVFGRRLARGTCARRFTHRRRLRRN